jgi:hypothetical protein
MDGFLPFQTRATSELLGVIFEQQSTEGMTEN